VIGPLVGGWLVSVGSWRSIFLINVPFTIVTLALVWVALPGRDLTRERARVDVVGGLLCVLGLGGPVYALIEAPNRGFTDPLILASLFGGLALLGAFVYWELHHDAPMLPLRLFRLRNFTFANVETFAVYAALSTLTFFLVLFLQQIAGYSPFRSGLATVPITFVMFFLSPRVGRLSMRVGPRFFMGVGPLICAAALLWIRELSPGFDYWTELLPPLLLFAVGLSLVVAPLTSTVLADAGERDAGIASGVNNAIARVAGLLGIAVVGAAIASSENALDLPGYRQAMAITAVLIGVGGVIGLAGIRNRPRADARA
jgi:predicted MFS family arabinose efflux permease